MQISMFIRERAGLRFNPYIAIGQFELVIDSDGFSISYGRREFGFIRGAGWHVTRAKGGAA